MPIRHTRAMAENDKLRRCLIVTDHALDDQQLTATVQQSLAAEPCQLHLLELATPAGTKTRVLWGGLGGSSAEAPNPGPAAEQGWDRAREQLAHNLVRRRKLGADADGETGEPPALRAIREVLARRPCDEIILATAPHRMTRLLAMDLHHRAQRSFGLPVTVLGTPGRTAERVLSKPVAQSTVPGRTSKQGPHSLWRELGKLSRAAPYRLILQLEGHWH
jgi:hypothetical protein